MAERERVEAAIVDGSQSIAWIDPRLKPLENLRVDHHITVASYFRLLIPEALPSELSRCLYLDADLIVRKSLEELWSSSLGGSALGAIQDSGVQTVGSDSGLLNYRELRLLGDEEYFNAGVLLMDLDLWRSKDLADQALRYAREQYEFIRWHDQDALNAIFAGDWHKLDSKWNKIVSPVGLYAEHDTDYSQAAVVHYATSAKPWHIDYSHPAGELFQSYVGRVNCVR